MNKKKTGVMRHGIKGHNVQNLIKLGVKPTLRCLSIRKMSSCINSYHKVIYIVDNGVLYGAGGCVLRGYEVGDFGFGFQCRERPAVKLD